MTIHELLAKFPADKINFQRLDQCIKSVKGRKAGGSYVQFCTDYTTMDVLSQNMALVVWIDGDVWNAMAREHAAQKKAAALDGGK